MTTDNQYFFGRMEKQLDQIAAEQAGLGKTLVEHGVRLTNVEGDVRDLKGREQAEQTGQIRHVLNGRQALWIGVAIAVFTAALSVVGALVTAVVTKSPPGP